MENEQTLKKRRHGCVTSFLLFLMIANSASILIYLFAADFLKNSLSLLDLTLSDKIILILFQIANFVSCFLLFQLKKIGFWVYVISNLVIVILNIYQGKGISQLWSALIGIAIMFGVMQITNKNKKTTWDELT
jgi:hypothetical protein